jgi:molybdopterin synthase sulfur carrier subunit
VQVTVFVPAALRQYVAGERKVRLDVDEPATLGRVFAMLHGRAPGVVERALDERGGIRQHVNVFVDGESIRTGARLGLDTPVAAGTEVWILPAVSGG